MVRHLIIVALCCGTLLVLPATHAQNTAVIPRAKLENDSYDWHARHARVMEAKSGIQPEIVLIGDSITHFWGGEPSDAPARGPLAWRALFGKSPVLNLGFGWDRTQNVLWRIDHGELDGINPRAVVIHIGTNNTSTTPNARANTAAEIAEGIAAICARVKEKLPAARIILMAIFPREEKPEAPRRVLINETNRLLARYAADNRIPFIDIGPDLLNPDGTLGRAMMSDFCHPTEAGYQIWADALRPALMPLAYPDPNTAPGSGGFNTGWPGFKGQWERRKVDFTKSRDHDKNTVVFLGDSITEGAPLAKLFPSLPTANRGISGDTSRGMLHRLDDNVLAIHPRAVVLLAGTNDLFQPGNSPSTTAANIKAICQAIDTRRPGTPVLVCKIMPNAKAPAAMPAAYNTAIERATAGMPGVTLVDTHDVFLKDGALNPVLFKDGVHPNDAGYAVFRNQLAPLLAKFQRP